MTTQNAVLAGIEDERNRHERELLDARNPRRSRLIETRIRRANRILRASERWIADNAARGSRG